MTKSPAFWGAIGGILGALFAQVLIRLAFARRRL